MDKQISRVRDGLEATPSLLMALPMTWGGDNPSRSRLPRQGQVKGTLSAFGPSVHLESTDSLSSGSSDSPAGCWGPRRLLGISSDCPSNIITVEIKEIANPAVRCIINLRNLIVS